MDKIAEGLGVMIITLISLCCFIIASAFLGGVAGWIVGLVFADTILPIFAQLGVHGVTMFQLGVFLGFIGGFMKTKVTAKMESK